eukprot:Colp12_sorted_trinity150504_noHs@12938
MSTPVSDTSEGGTPKPVFTTNIRVWVFKSNSKDPGSCIFVDTETCTLQQLKLEAAHELKLEIPEQDLSSLTVLWDSNVIVKSVSHLRDGDKLFVSVQENKMPVSHSPETSTETLKSASSLDLAKRAVGSDRRKNSGSSASVTDADSLHAGNGTCNQCGDDHDVGECSVGNSFFSGLSYSSSRSTPPLPCAHCNDATHQTKDCNYEFLLPSSANGQQPSLTSLSVPLTGSASSLQTPPPSLNSAPTPVPQQANGLRYRLRSCFSCGQPGHESKHCPTTFPTRSTPACFTCGQPGHMTRDCTLMNGMANLGVSERGCFTCGGQGHISRDCPSLPSVALKSYPCLCRMFCQESS